MVIASMGRDGIRSQLKSTTVLKGRSDALFTLTSSIVIKKDDQEHIAGSQKNLLRVRRYLVLYFMRQGVI